MQHLRERLGLDDGVIDRFFRPFFGGIFNAPLEEQSSVLFEFVLRMFLDGSAALPAGGLGAVPAQLAQRVRDAGGSIHVRSAVRRVDLGQPSHGEAHRVMLADGRTLTCDHLIVATERAEAARLLGQPRQASDASDASVPNASRRLTSACLYFAIEGAPPVADPVLVLNGRLHAAPRAATNAVINTLCFPSVVSRSYAPPGRHLASVTVVGDRALAPEDELERDVREELARMFGGDEVSGWKHLRTYVIERQPRPPPNPGGFNQPARAPQATGVYVCGEHCATPSLNGALRSGRLAAEAIFADRQAAGQ